MSEPVGGAAVAFRRVLDLVATRLEPTMISTPQKHPGQSCRMIIYKSQALRQCITEA